MNAHLFSAVLLAAGLWLPAQPLSAQSPTTLRLSDVEATYSHAVEIVATLTTPDGGVHGAQVDFTLRDESGSVVVDIGHGPTDGEGQVKIHVPMVGGCPQWNGTALKAGSQGSEVPYVVEASYVGDTQFRPAAGNAVLRLRKEDVQVKVVQGTMGQLGQPLTIVAAVEDPDGDAPCNGSAGTGGGPATVAGRTLAFYLDYTGDHDWSDAREFLGTDVTRRDDANLDAVASVVASTTPVAGRPRAGRSHGAIQIQLPANDPLYAPATAQVDMVLEPAPVDPAKCVVEADPSEAQAGGTPILLRVTLRDAFDNPLDFTAPAHDVSLSVKGDSLGARLEGDVQRNPDTGKYEQTLLGASRKGKVTVQATVDGATSTSVEVNFTGIFPVGPCACVHPGRAQGTVWAILLLAIPWVRARQRSRRDGKAQ